MNCSRYKPEIEWWRQHLAKNDEWLKIKCEGHALDSKLKEFIKDKDYFKNKSHLKIADLGCGPVSMIGIKDDTYQIEILGIDPLVGEYNKILADKKIVRPHDVVCMECEYAYLLGENTFDIVFSRNAIDHSEEPDKIMMSGKLLCKTNGLFQIRVHENEGKSQNYAGLHQWNFYVDNEDVMIESPTFKKKFTAKEILGPNLIIEKHKSHKNVPEIFINYFKD
jgi:SAM-dependent methyltransferase